jgi:hypothetical protein
MTTPVPFPPALRAELETSEERRLTADEFEARVRAPWTAEELDDFDELVRWFTKRYPTPLARLQATRHLLAEWRRSAG